jgi:hypothetical protein
MIFSAPNEPIGGGGERGGGFQFFFLDTKNKQSPPLGFGPKCLNVQSPTDLP